VLGDVVEKVVGDLCGGVLAVEVGSGDIVVEGGLDGVFQGFGFGAPAEEVEEHTSSEDRAERVSDSLPCDIRRGAVDGFEERGAAGMDVPGGGEAKPAGELGGKVGDDIAEEIVGDDDIELPGIADEFHGEGIDVEVAGIHVGIFGADRFEDALPEIARESHSVGFVRHAKAKMPA